MFPDVMACQQRPTRSKSLCWWSALTRYAMVGDAERLRKILTTHARPVAKEIGYDSKFDFLRSPAACICQIRLLDEQRAKNRPAEPPFEERFLTYINKVIADEPAEYPS